MNLLDRPGRDLVTVYPAEEKLTPDGNVSYQPGTLPIEATATIQPLSSQDTNDPRGYGSVELYRCRFPRAFATELLPGSVVVWRGDEYRVDTVPQRYNGSAATSRVEYLLKRS